LNPEEGFWYQIDTASSSNKGKFHVQNSYGASRQQGREVPAGLPVLSILAGP
jgi:hypothetical protein